MLKFAQDERFAHEIFIFVEEIGDTEYEARKNTFLVFDNF